MTGSGRGLSARIIGIGNLFRGDDAAGLLAARRLKDLVGDRAEVMEADPGGLDLLDLMADASTLILIDAARSGRPPGTIQRLDASAGPVSGGLFPHSSHAFTALDAIELGRTLGLLPPRVIVFGVEVGDTGTGLALSPGGRLGLDRVVEEVLREVEGPACPDGPEG